jgi:hypothetical protein
VTHRRVFPLVLGCLLAARGASAGDPPPAPVAVYLPFPADVSWKVETGNDLGSHKDEFNKYAFDFACRPEGQPVCAVLDGTVEFVKEDEHEATGSDKDNNRIVVRHEDQTLAEYVHLQKNGVFFDVGERVVAGDVIGLSGDTGASKGPHLHFGLRRRDKDGPSIPCRFVEVEGDGVPKQDQLVKSQNVAVREQYGWRETRLALDLWPFLRQIDATSVGVPLLDKAVKSPPKIKHPSVDALLKERDQIVEEHRQAAVDESQKLKDAKAEKNLDALARLATLSVLDFADVPALVKELRAIPAAFGKDPDFAAAMARAKDRLDYRKLVADAVKEEATASSRFIPKKNDPSARPDYAAAIIAWERARAKAPDADMGSAIRRHGEALKTAR